MITTNNILYTYFPVEELKPYILTQFSHVLISASTFFNENTELTKFVYDYGLTGNRKLVITKTQNNELYLSSQSLFQHYNDSYPNTMPKLNNQAFKIAICSVLNSNDVLLNSNVKNRIILNEDKLRSIISTES